MRRWCKWCGEDLPVTSLAKRRVGERLEPIESQHFCNVRCEREFWRDVYQSGDDAVVVARSFL